MKKVFLFLFFCVFMLSAQDSFAQNYKPAGEVSTILAQEMIDTKASQTATLSAASLNSSCKYTCLKALCSELDQTKDVAVSVDAVYDNLITQSGANATRIAALEAAHQEIVEMISN